MDKIKTFLKNLDSMKIYISLIGVLSLIALVWLIYNYFQYRGYQRDITRGLRDFNKIIELEPNIPAKAQLDGDQEIQNELTFFTRSVPNNFPEQPEVELGAWEPGNIAGVVFQEKRYTVQFKAISRQNLLQYVYGIQNKKNFLRVKRLELRKTENSLPYEDKWKVEVEFAQRKPQ